MDGNSSKRRVLFYSFVLIVGLLLSTSYFMRRTYYWGNNFSEIPAQYELTLTVDSPVFRYNISYDSVQIEIERLQTNNTRVGLVVRGPTRTDFNATNVTSLTGFSVARTVFEDDWWVEIVRQESDVNVSIDLRYWIPLIRPPVADPILPYPLILGGLLSLFAIIRLIIASSRLGSDWKMFLSPPAIIILFIIGTQLIIPLWQGSTNDDFIPLSTSTTLPSNNYLFVLNETSPSASIDLSGLYPSEGSNVQFRVVSINSTKHPFLVSVVNTGEHNLTIEMESQSANWWLSFLPNSNSSIIFAIQRLDSNLNCSFAVETRYTILTARQEILVPAQYATLGVGLFVIGVVLAILTDWKTKGDSASK
ncbi:MAG: hypothetical protein E3J86_10120 [Candidatus Thorarchaeota archaeon]|nr:MAG: hypothetical protein E3J86_10120 [Candidatus Thorarchaeota archaeon]